MNGINEQIKHAKTVKEIGELLSVSLPNERRQQIAARRITQLRLKAMREVPAP